MGAVNERHNRGMPYILKAAATSMIAATTVVKAHHSSPRDGWGGPADDGECRRWRGRAGVSLMHQLRDVLAPYGAARVCI